MEAAFSVYPSGGLQYATNKEHSFKYLFPAGYKDSHTADAAALSSRLHFNNNATTTNNNNNNNNVYSKYRETLELLQKKTLENGYRLQMFIGDNNSTSSTKNVDLSARTLALALCFGGVGGFMRVLLAVLPPDFWDRWHKLVGQEQEPSGNGIRTESDAGTIIYDCHGTVIATIVPSTSAVSEGKQGRRGRRRHPLRPVDIPSYMWQAVVASEDRSFFEHHGIDPKGIARATLTMTAGGGGSTITQQLVKNVFLTNERKLARKVVEMILALLVEKHMSKWEILHSYLNKIYWGHGTYGIETASAFYFGKHPSLLTLGECAMLAGIIPAPELLSPFRDPSRGKKPQARALRRMVEAGFLDAETAASVVNEHLCLGPGQGGASGPRRAPYFVSEVLYELAQKYGQDAILRDGLQVYTTLDLEKQEIAEKIIREGAAEYDKERLILAEQGLFKAQEKLQNLYKAREGEIDKAVARAVARVQVEMKHSVKSAVDLSENDNLSRKAMEDEAVAAASRKACSTVIQKYLTAEKYFQAVVSNFEEELRQAAKARLEGAAVAIDPLSGAIRVLIGGRDYYENSFNRATLACRSPGSTFKPVVYLAALAEGINRDHILIDEPYTYGGFTPENYDCKFRGKVTLAKSLVKSLNVPTVRLCAEIGVDKVCDMGRALGIETPLPYELSLSLGGCEVTPLQLATVYTTIASGGFYHKPYFIRRVESGDGQVLEEHLMESVPAVDGRAVSELRRLLQAVVEHGTGCGARLGRPCAGKTGTSDGHRDVWFAGFTPELSCVVWFGYDNNARIGGLHPATGASHAAPIWQRFMKIVHKGLPINKFHDIGIDKHGMHAPREFKRKSRRVYKIGLPEVRKFINQYNDKVPCNEIWDWESASSIWEEKEKMEEWTANQIKQVAKINADRASWKSIFPKSNMGIFYELWHLLLCILSFYKQN